MIKNKFLISLSVILGISIILSLLFASNSFESANLRLTDKLYTFQKPLDNIVIVAIDDKSIQEIGRWPWPRDVFANALGRLSNASVIGLDVSFFEKSETEKDLLLQNEINSLPVVLVSECVYSGNCTWIRPIFNASYGYANILVKNDIVRTVPLKLEGEISFSKAVLEKYGIQTEEEKALIQFSRHKTISFSDLMNTSEDFSDKIVLIGATAKDLHDEASTPLGLMPGIEVHASAIQTILTNTELNYQNKIWVIVFIFVLSLITLFFLEKFKLAYAIIASFCLLIVYSAIAIFAFDSKTIMNILYPILSVILTFVSLMIIYYILESGQRKFLTNLFGKYVSPSVADELIKKGKEAANLNGIKKEVTVLFADVRGFTSLSEKESPEKIVALLNRYHGKMTDIIFEHNGTIDKFVGDEIMVTFNVPLDLKDHALTAVKTAIEMQIEAKKLGTAIQYGIGINTGPAIVGNIGSEKRLDFTVIGDAVNLGARLCGKAEPNQILLSESTNALVKDQIKTKSIGEITVKGKEKPLEVFEVIF